MTIGQRIAELRKRNSLSQEALGEALGVSRQAISKWESDAALPEIDKLIALSKRFGVTVGWLLGVEEEAPAAAGDSSSARTGETAGAEALERYLESLPKARPLSPRAKRRLTLAGAAVAVCLVVLFVRIGALQAQLSGMNNSVNYLTSQMAGVQSQIGGLSDVVSQQVQDALEQEYGVTASWELALEEVDYQDGLAGISFRCVLREPVEGTEDVEVYAMLSGGGCIVPEEENWDAELGAYTARLKVPLENGISYYLAAGGVRVCLAREDHSLCSLADGTALQCYSYFTGSISGAAFHGEVTVDVFLPWLVPEQQGEPEVRIWLVQDGVRKRELDVEKSGTDDGWERHCCAGVEYDGLSLEEGTQFWFEYEVSFPGGLSGAGTNDEVWIWDGQNWESEAQVIEQAD